MHSSNNESLFHPFEQKTVSNAVGFHILMWLFKYGYLASHPTEISGKLTGCLESPSVLSIKRNADSERCPYYYPLQSERD